MGNPGLLLLSLVVAIVAWGWVQGRQTQSVRVRVDIVLVTAENLINTEQEVSTASAVLEGPLSAIRRAQILRPVLVVDLQKEKAGAHEVPLESMTLKDLPVGLKATGFSPDVLRVRLEPRVRRTVPVHTQWVGTAADGFAVEAVTVEPEKVTISGARAAMDGVDAVLMRPIDVSALSGSTTMPAELDLPRGVEVSGTWVGLATVTLQAEETRLVVTDIPVLVRAPGWGPAPGQERVTLTLNGPATVLRDLPIDRIVAVVELPPDPSSSSYSARFRAAKAPRLDVLLPREDVVQVAVPPRPVEVVRQ